MNNDGNSRECGCVLNSISCPLALYRIFTIQVSHQMYRIVCDAETRTLCKNPLIFTCCAFHILLPFVIFNIDQHQLYRNKRTKTGREHLSFPCYFFCFHIPFVLSIELFTENFISAGLVSSFKTGLLKTNWT